MSKTADKGRCAPQERKSLFRIMRAIIYSGFIGTGLATIVAFFPIGILMAPFAMLIGNFIFGAFLYPVALLINVFLDRKGLATKRNVISCGVGVSFLYGVIHIFLNKADIYMLVVFTLTGLFASWIYWNDLYSDKKGFRIL